MQVVGNVVTTADDPTPRQTTCKNHWLGDGGVWF